MSAVHDHLLLHVDADERCVAKLDDLYRDELDVLVYAFWWLHATHPDTHYWWALEVLLQQVPSYVCTWMGASQRDEFLAAVPEGRGALRRALRAHLVVR